MDLIELQGTDPVDLDMSTEDMNSTSNVSLPLEPDPRGPSVWTVTYLSLYAIICVAGLVGNGLVIYVVLRYSTMRNSVTNTYIINLAVSDFCFLIGLPFVITTAVRRGWIFGSVLCKLFYISTSLNWFTSVFTLTVMSADRYLAVCYAIESRRFRTPFISRVICGAVWVASLLVMMPIYLYCRTVENNGTVSCTIKWPEGHISAEYAESAFLWYAFVLAFAVPVPMISVFYFLVVARLRKVGPNKQSKGKKKSQRKVTIMVLTVITVYIICWLPYWLFQLILLTIDTASDALISLYQLITLLSYANSACNPILYAFLSENFRKTFARAFGCANTTDVNCTLLTNNRQSTAVTQLPKNGDAVTVSPRLHDDEKKCETLVVSAKEPRVQSDVSTTPSAACAKVHSSGEMEMEILLDSEKQLQSL